MGCLQAPAFARVAAAPCRVRRLLACACACSGTGNHPAASFLSATTAAAFCSGSASANASAARAAPASSADLAKVVGKKAPPAAAAAAAAASNAEGTTDVDLAPVSYKGLAHPARRVVLGTVSNKALKDAHEAEPKGVPALLQDETGVSKSEKYEKELKDPRTRELMYAEKAEILDKDGRGKFVGSKRGLHDSMLVGRIVPVMALLLILAQPICADLNITVFGDTPYTLVRWDLAGQYGDFHNGSYRAALLEKGPEFHGLNLMRFPQCFKVAPRGWIALEVMETGSEDRATLAIRDDNIYVVGFANRDGVWYCFKDQGRVLPCDPDNNVLTFTGSYGREGLMSAEIKCTPRGADKFIDSRARIDMLELVLGQDAAREAMAVLSSYAPATSSDTEQVKWALRVLVVMVSEAQRFFKVSAPIIAAWPGPVSLTDVDFIWAWTDISCSMITYWELKQYPAAAKVKARKLESVGVDTYQKAVETVDLVEMPYNCLNSNYRDPANKKGPLLDDFTPPDTAGRELKESIGHKCATARI